MGSAATLAAPGSGTLRHPFVLVLLIVSALPTLAGLVAALWVGVDGAALARVLATPGVGVSLATSVWSGIAALLLSLLLAHMAVALAVTGGWRRRLSGCALPLLAMPHLAVGIGLALVLAPSGLLLRLLSPWPTGFALPPDWMTVRDPLGLSLILGLTLKETCFLILALTAAMSQVSVERYRRQASALGYGPLKAWIVGVAPLLQRQIRLPLAAVLVFGVSNVELAIPLGPGLPPTFSVLLWRWFTDPDPAVRAQAYAGTLVLLAVVLLCLAGLVMAGTLVRKLVGGAAQSGTRRTRERPLRRLLGTALGALWLLGMTVLVAIALRSAAGPWRFPSLWPAGDGWSSWHSVLPTIGEVGITTVSLALATAVVGVALVVPGAERCRDDARARRVVGLWLFLPLLVPQMTFLFGVQVLLAALHVDGTLFAVVWAHLVFALPYLWGLLAPARAEIDARYRQVALTLGVAPLQAWRRVTLPLLARALLLALALAFSVSVALYLPTLFAGAGRVSTAATEAAAAAASGSLRLAAVHAILLALAPLAAFAAAYGGAALLFRQRQGVPR